MFIPAFMAFSIVGCFERWLNNGSSSESTSDDRLGLSRGVSKEREGGLRAIYKDMLQYTILICGGSIDFFSTLRSCSHRAYYNVCPCSGPDIQVFCASLCSPTSVNWDAVLAQTLLQFPI